MYRMDTVELEEIGVGAKTFHYAISVYGNMICLDNRLLTKPLRPSFQG